jgi:hypothetical protein
MEAYGSVSWPKKLTTCPYSGPNNYSSWVLIPFFKIHFNIILPYTHSDPSGLLSGFPTKNLHAFFLSPYITHSPAISTTLI